MCIAVKLQMDVPGGSVFPSDRTSDTDEFKEVRKVGGVHTCLAPTMSQDHRQLDSSLICKIILPLIQSNPSISILALQGAVRQNHHFKPSYRKV
ncbi:hypothetical protein Ahy_B06g084907 isoform B [Arachis hypogaea]|uniref:Uncharacterized protein n=1 Tax=Arachis hypogaea TaxID=3818 RepID=A0A444YT25_ARAHY|nr:hypothetical protein Ahy_B06g084907 isoform B [Arachis hypogaea]